MEKLQQPLERGDGGRTCIRVSLVETLFDGLGVPVAEVVEGDVVQLVDEMREVELVEEPLHLPLSMREPRQDPALLQRPRALGRLRALGREQDQAGDVPELVRELPSLFDIRPPVGAWTREWMTTSRKGTSPIISRPAKIMRFSQSRMMSRAVVFRSPG